MTPLRSTSANCPTRPDPASASPKRCHDGGTTCGFRRSWWATFRVAIERPPGARGSAAFRRPLPFLGNPTSVHHGCPATIEHATETHSRKVVAETRIAACALIAAGQTFPTLLWQHRTFANAAIRLADLADQSEGEDLQRLSDELLALFHVLSEALINHYGPALAAHAERLKNSVEQVEERLYPPLPPDHADDATLRAYANSISGAADRLRKAGFSGLSQGRGHVLHDIIRIVWSSPSAAPTSIASSTGWSSYATSLSPPPAPSDGVPRLA
jgi:hypothetical protein